MRPACRTRRPDGGACSGGTDVIAEPGGGGERAPVYSSTVTVNARDTRPTTERVGAEIAAVVTVRGERECNSRRLKRPVREHGRQRSRILIAASAVLELRKKIRACKTNIKKKKTYIIVFYYRRHVNPPQLPPVVSVFGDVRCASVSSVSAGSAHRRRCRRRVMGQTESSGSGKRSPIVAFTVCLSVVGRAFVRLATYLIEHHKSTPGRRETRLSTTSSGRGGRAHWECGVSGVPSPLRLSIGRADVFI